MEKNFETPFYSILDNDFYKFTMQCAVIQLFPDVKARYAFINRGKHPFPQGFGALLQTAVNEMAQLSLTRAEHAFLSQKCPYLNAAYLDFLLGYRYDPSEVSITQNGDDLEVVVEGNWYRTILWEVPLLSLISELYYKTTRQERKSDKFVVENTIEKAKTFRDLDITVAEFGTRRRHSYEVQKLVVETLNAYGGKSFVGTSNVHLAMLCGGKPIGTHAHEWFMFHAAQYGFRMANTLSLQHWADVYRGDLGIALSDTYTSAIFFQAFDKKFAKLFDGVRHDSGDPIAFAEQTIAHYQSLGINPLFKFIIFSDGLNMEKVEAITMACKGRIGVSFGIGTHLTNDVGLKPMNIVMKLTEVNAKDTDWIPVVKLSDEPGKHTGTPKMIDLAKAVLNLE